MTKKNKGLRTVSRKPLNVLVLSVYYVSRIVFQYTINHQLSTINYQLSTVNYQLFSTELFCKANARTLLIIINTSKVAFEQQ